MWDAIRGQPRVPLLRLSASAPFQLFSISYVALGSEIGAKKSTNLSSVPECQCCGSLDPEFFTSTTASLTEADACHTEALGLDPDVV